MTDIAATAPADAGAKPKKKSKKKLILLLLVVLLGAGGGYFAMYGMPGSHKASAEEEEHADQPQLVVREGATASAAARTQARTGRPDPRVFQTTYIPLEGNFTSNLRGGDNFVQVGLGLSTFYDDKVKESVERNMMAIRSAIILALSEADPVEITTISGKEALKDALKNAINRVLTNQEGFGGIDAVYFTSFVTQ